jgi:hypothetical protein
VTARNASTDAASAFFLARSGSVSISYSHDIDRRGRYGFLAGTVHPFSGRLTSSRSTASSEQCEFTLFSPKVFVIVHGWNTIFGIAASVSLEQHRPARSLLVVETRRPIREVCLCVD